MRRPLRILHIGNGGAFKIRAIVDGLLRRGHEIHMVPIPPLARAWRGVSWHSLDTPPALGKIRVPIRLLQVRRLAHRLRPDLVHAHNAWGPGWYGAATGLHPLVIHAYGGDILPEQYRARPELQRRLTSWACRTADRVVVTGQHMIGAASELGIPASRLVTIPRGVDLKRYRPDLDTGSLRSQLRIAAGAPVILSPRYQVDEALYNFDIIIESFRSVRDRFPAAICVQMYDPARGNGHRQLERLAATHGLGASYRLVPAVDNDAMPLFYNLADVAVSVPSSDGFPVSVLEASACGTPLIVSDLPYCKEWFSPGENGLVVPVRDTTALAQAIVAVLSDAGLRAGLGTASRKLVESRSDYEKCMDALEDQYYGLLGEVARREPPAS